MRVIVKFEVYHLYPGKGKHPETQMAKYSFMLSFSERKKVVSKCTYTFQLRSTLSHAFVFL